MKALIKLLLCSMVLFASCSKNDTANTDEDSKNGPKEGVFIDSPVLGISYSTPSHSGKTDEMGRFFYEPGERVKFSIGDIALPEVTADKIVHITQIFNSDINDQRVINLARLLLTLDQDQNPENGVSIPASAFSASQGVVVNFSSTSFDDDVSNYIASAGGASVLVAETIAKTHIEETLEETNNFTSEEEDASFYGCGDACVQRANYNDFVASFYPRHQQVNVSINTKIELKIIENVNTGTGEFHVELFPIKANSDRCRIDFGGFICGDDAPYDTDAAFENIINGTSFLEGTTSVNPIIFGSANIDANNNIVITPESTLSVGTTYVVHVFANEEFNDFKTWWIFRT